MLTQVACGPVVVKAVMTLVKNESWRGGTAGATYTCTLHIQQLTSRAPVRFCAGNTGRTQLHRHSSDARPDVGAFRAEMTAPRAFEVRYALASNSLLA